MTNVKVLYDLTGKIKGFDTNGHSGYAEHGKDIVCAAVSVLMQTAVQSIEYVADVANVIYETKGPGSMKVVLPDNLLPGTRWSKAKIILESILIGFEGIEATYPEYVQIEHNDKE